MRGGKEMAKASKAQQIIFSVPNRVGLLSEVSTALSAAKVSITAFAGYEMDNHAYFMMITDNNAKAKKVLAKLGIATQDQDVLMVEMPNKVGEIAKLSGATASAGIDILESYGTAGSGKASVLVLKTTDDKKALKLLNK
jgi:hypothetical protein